MAGHTNKIAFQKDAHQPPCNKDEQWSSSHEADCGQNDCQTPAKTLRKHDEKRRGGCCAHVLWFMSTGNVFIVVFVMAVTLHKRLRQTNMPRYVVFHTVLNHHVPVQPSQKTLIPDLNEICNIHFEQCTGNIRHEICNICHG